MPEFLELIPPDEARALILDSLAVDLNIEMIATAQALGRVIAEDIHAPHPLPEFARSTVDGYAVRAEDTYGASEGLPAYLNIAGEVAMGAAAAILIKKATCAVIHTGGMIPQGADAVVMLEYTQQPRPDEIEIARAVAVGENIIRTGEDVSQGERVISAGTRLRAVEIGGLMAFGVTRVKVYRQPRVAIVSSGDEIIPPELNPNLGQVRDVNAYTLGALASEVGGIPIHSGIIPDDRQKLEQAARDAYRESDMLIITAGSSASARDLTSSVIQTLGEPGILVHGVNLRPVKPTILAICDHKPVIGLPGNPVSAYVVAWLLVKPALEKLMGLGGSRPKATVHARLKLNVASQAGREDWIAVRLEQDGEGYLAAPVFGKSNLIFTLVRADGIIKIPLSANGIQAGEPVEVYLL